MSIFNVLEAEACSQLISMALVEDLRSSGDRTSNALIPPDQDGRAAMVVRSAGVIAGLPAAALVCTQVDPRLRLEVAVSDGAMLPERTTVATVSGPLRSLLAAERTALNFLQRLSGIATLTRQYVEAMANPKVQLLDTRKTTPGWRLLEKYAVRAGGGTNHRMGLYDGILIKDNHIAGLGDPRTAVCRAIEQARSYRGDEPYPIEVEVDTLDQLSQALTARPDIVLLDNMSLHQLRQAVEMRDRLGPGIRLEASGGVTLRTIRAIAETGVDRISVGALTHSATALDIGLDYTA